jgi:hypothetical protein
MRAPVVCVSVLFLTSCQPCQIAVKVTGSIEHGVTFEFFDTHNIEHAILSTRDATGQWRSIWSVGYQGFTRFLRYAKDGPPLQKGRTEGLPAQCGTQDCIQRFRWTP